MTFDLMQEFKTTETIPETRFVVMTLAIYTNILLRVPAALFAVFIQIIHRNNKRCLILTMTRMKVYV